MNLLKRTTALLVVTLLLGTAGCNKSSGDAAKSSGAARPSSGAAKSSSAATSSSDAAITSRVKTAISKEPGLKGTKVSVSTDKKVVHLGGTVKSREERAMLIAAARKVEGVKAVKTNLVVKPQQKAAVEARGTREPRPQQRVTQRAAEFQGTGR